MAKISRWYPRGDGQGQGHGNPHAARNDTIYYLMLLVTLFSGDFLHLNCPKSVEKVQERFVTMMYRYIRYWNAEVDADNNANNAVVAPNGVSKPKNVKKSLHARSIPHQVAMGDLVPASTVTSTTVTSTAVTSEVTLRERRSSAAILGEGMNVISYARQCMDVVRQYCPMAATPKFEGAKKLQCTEIKEQDVPCP